MMDKTKMIATLTAIYEMSLQTNKFEELSTVLASIKINNIINMYKHYEEPIMEEDTTIMGLIIKILQNLYNNSGVESPVTDEDYDILYELYVNNTETKDIVGAPVVKHDAKVANHNYPDLRGTLDKIHFITRKEKGNDKRKSLEEWINSLENKLGRKLLDSELKAKMYPKFDGTSTIFECDKNGNVINALTRGDTKINEAVVLNHIFGAIKFPTYSEWNSDFGIKTEVIMTYSNFEKFCKKYGEFKSPRSAVSSIVNTDGIDTKVLKYISIIPLRIQNYDTKEIIIPGKPFIEYPVLSVNLRHYSHVKQFITEMKEYMKTIMDIPIDGVVLVLDDKNLRKELGRDEAINKYEVAYKLVPDSKKSKLIDVEFSIGVLGGITPVAKIEPIKMEGNTITNVSLGSIDRCESLHLNKEDEVLIRYNIVPYLYVDDTCKKGDGEPIVTPTRCEYCGEKLWNEPILRCVNPDCPSRVVGKIVNYVTKMNIENISIGIVSELFKQGILKSIEDLYRLDYYKTRIVNLDGFGAKKYNNIVKGIDKRKDVFDYVLLGSLGIPDIGQRMFKKILNHYTVDELITICEKGKHHKLTEIDGIKETTANKIVVGILSNAKLIQFLMKELNVKHDGTVYKMKVLFTQIRDKEFEKYLKEKEIEVCKSYTKNIDIVICENKNKSTDKIDKAKKDNKMILTLEEAYKYFKYK